MIFNQYIKETVTPNLPKNEKNAYRVIVLDNDLKVTLISDEHTDKSAVALNVNIGSLSNPKEIPGLAHFCEHMVFMGSEKYPEENYFTKYLSQHNGSYNAYTSSVSTNFYFEIKPEKMLDVIDIFAQFFISPLFTESAVDRELQAVNSEHEKNLSVDSRRMLQLDRHLSDPSHDYNHFCTGNMKTLRDDPKAKSINVHEHLLKFHSKYYSSNIMNLCVYGKESLDVLQEKVIGLFCKVENKNVEVPVWNTSPWSNDVLQKMIYVNPVQERYELLITWPIPNYSRSYTAQPDYYISHLLGHETKGSILAVLKKTKWVHNLLTQTDNSVENFAQLTMTIYMHEEGINHIEEIITIVYQYIYVLKTIQPQEWIFDEMKKIKGMEFEFKENSSLELYVSKIARNMTIYSLEHVVKGPYALEEFCPEKIKDVVACLTPTNMRCFLSSKKYVDKCTQHEQWYGTPYSVEDISPELIQKWNNVTNHPELHLPEPNPYIASDFSLKAPSAEAGSSDDKNVPSLIRHTDVYRWWFCQDFEYHLPKGFVSIFLINHLSLVDPTYYMMNQMIVELFKDYCNDVVYDAYLAGLTFNISSQSYGIKLQFLGFNEKISTFVKTMLEHLISFKVTLQTFEDIKSLLYRFYRNFELAMPLYQANQFMSCLTSDIKWTYQECLSTINEVTYENFSVYFKMFFTRLFVESLIYGNFSKLDAEEIVTNVEGVIKDKFNVLPLYGSQLTICREVMLPENSNFVFHYENTHQPASVLLIYLQGLIQDIKVDVITKLVNLILSEPLFDKLRTKEQLGYIVGCWVMSSNSVQGHRIMVQSTKKPMELDKRVDNFLMEFYNELEKMPDEEFQNYVIALQEKIIEKPKNMQNMYNKLWYEIYLRHYNFKRASQEYTELTTVKKLDVLNYYKTIVHPTSKKLKKLAVHVTSSQVKDDIGDVKMSNTREMKSVVIEDINRFKKSLPLSPIIEPLLSELPIPKL